MKAVGFLSVDLSRWSGMRCCSLLYRFIICRGYPLSLRALLTTNSSVFCCTRDDDRVQALVKSVLITNTLCCSGWCDEKSRYLSVWVGFLYTDVPMLPSSLWCRRTSRYGRVPSDSTSNVNWMFGLILLRWSWKLWTVSMCIAVRASSTYLFQNLGGRSKVESAFFQSLSSPGSQQWQKRENPLLFQRFADSSNPDTSGK